MTDQPTSGAPHDPQQPQQPDPTQQGPYTPQQGPYAPGPAQPGPAQPGSYAPGPGQPGPYPQGQYPQGQYSPGQYPPAAYGAPDQQIPPPTRRKRRPIAIVGSVLVAIVVAVGVRLAFGAFTGVASAHVGDCLHYADGDTRLRKADCGSSDANQKLFGITTDTKACADVAGAEYALEVSNNKIFCFGDKNVDPATAVNAAQVGSCLTVSGNDASTAASCAAGTYPVLAVKKDVQRSGGDDFESTCGDVSGADSAYGWSLGASNRPVNLTYDRVYCLGPTK